MNALDPTIAVFIVCTGLVSIARSEAPISDSPPEVGDGNDRVEVVLQPGSGLAFDPELDAVWCDKNDAYHLSGLPFFATCPYGPSVKPLKGLLDEEELKCLFPELDSNPAERRKEAFRFAVFAFSDLYDGEDIFSRFFFATNACGVKQDESWQIERILDRLSSLGFFERSTGGVRTVGSAEGDSIRVSVGNGDAPFVVSLSRRWVGPQQCVLLPDDLSIPESDTTRYSREPGRRRFTISPSSAFSIGEVRLNGAVHRTYLVSESRNRESNDIEFVQELIRLGHVEAMKRLWAGGDPDHVLKDVFLTDDPNATTENVRRVAMEEMSRRRFWEGFLAEHCHGSDKLRLVVDDDVQIKKLAEYCISGFIATRDPVRQSRLRWTKVLSENKCRIDVFDEPLKVRSFQLTKRWVGPNRFMWVVSDLGRSVSFEY